MLVALCTVAMLHAKSNPYIGWGLETMENIRKNYLLPDGKLYADAIEGDKKSGPAFNWGVGVLMGAMTSAARYDERWKPRLRSFVESTRVYWNDKGPVPGYDVLPGPKDVDRFYDDNEWMVLALVNASDVLQEPKFLRYAEQTLKYVLSGEDGKLGGGLYWHETKKTEKNACSNAPGAAACLAVYTKNHDPALLAKAKELYNWTKSHLEDPSDGLMWDGISLDGKIDKTKWTYNTALMIRTAIGLASITHETTYAEDAKKMIRVSATKWYDPSIGTIRDEGRFAHLLLESWSDQSLPEIPSMIHGTLTYLRLHRSSGKGMFGKRFDSPPSQDATKFELIDQASAARAFFSAGRLSQF